MRLLGRRPPEALQPAPRSTGGLAPFTFPSLGLAVSREQAMSLSVVANARHLIVGISSQLSLDRLRGSGEDSEKLDPGTILTQPDPDETWGTTIGYTVDDLIFYGGSDWLVLRRDAEDFPTRARRLPPGSVAIIWDTDYSKWSRIREISVSGSEIAPRDLIRIQFPSNGVLRDGAAIILSAIQLQAAADRFANVPLPAGVLTNTGQEIGEKDAKVIVEAFDSAREAGATAFLQSMSYERTQLNAADLQLVESMASMDTRLARMMNVPVSMVGASPSGNARAQLYSNVGQSLTQLVQQAIAPYLVCIEDAMTTFATPRGQRCAFNTGDWLRFASVAVPISQAAGTDAPPPPTPEGIPQ